MPQLLESLKPSMGYDPLDPSEGPIQVEALRLPELPNGDSIGPLFSALEVDLLSREWEAQLRLWEFTEDPPSYSQRVGFQGTGCSLMAVALKPVPPIENRTELKPVEHLRSTSIDDLELLTKDARKAFRKADKDSSGSLDKEETACLMEDMGFPPPEDFDFDKLFAKFDPDESGLIESHEFERLYQWVRARASFLHYDTDSSGVLEQGEAVAMLEKVSVWKTDIRIIISMFDKDCDGVIDVEEFMELYEARPSPKSCLVSCSAHS